MKLLSIIAATALLVTIGPIAASAQPSSTPSPVQPSGEVEEQQIPCTTTPSSTTTPIVPPPTATPTAPSCAEAPAAAPEEETPAISTTTPIQEQPSTTTQPAPRTTDADESTAPGEKIPYTGLPTENPNSTIIPGKMRSDREELPDGFTKEQADNAEVREAELQRIQTQQIAARAIPQPGADCSQYWPSENWVCGAIRDKYNSLGAQFSFLAFPTSEELVNPDGFGRRQTFANGPIYWSPSGGAHPVVNHFFAAWQRQGWEGGVLGYPTTDEIVNPDGIGRRQEFQGAAIYWRLNEAYAIGGAIRDKWNTVGAEGGPLGYPTSDEVGVVKNNGRYNNFENGTITWSGPTGARLLYGPIRDRWVAAGREDGPLGLPLTDEQSVADGAVHFADFEDGSSIWWTSVTGAHIVGPDIAAAWRGAGGYLGSLGLPVAASISAVPGSSGVTLQQVFENGVVNLLGNDRAYIGMYDSTPDSFPEPSSGSIAPSPDGPAARAVPPGATWPPPDVDEDYDTAAVVGTASNSHRPNSNNMVIRQGYWSNAWDDGWGQDKAEHHHGLMLVDSIEFVLESRYWTSRTDSSNAGTDFYAYAIEQTCQVGWTGKECEEISRRVVHAIYDPTPFPDGYKLAPAGAPGPVGVITAYCGGGTSPLANTQFCDSWVDIALLNPEN